MNGNGNRRLARRWVLPIARTMVVTTLAVGWGATARSAVASAQEVATPVVSTDPTGIGYPATIFHGTCDNLDQVASPLAPVGALAPGAGTPTPSDGAVGASAAIRALRSVTELAVPIDDLLSGEHAIVVTDHASDAVLTCGAIGGDAFGDTLLFGLAAVADSGFTGIALIAPEEDGNTNVVVYVAETGATSGAATPLTTTGRD